MDLHQEELIHCYLVYGLRLTADTALPLTPIDSSERPDLRCTLKAKPGSAVPSAEPWYVSEWSGEAGFPSLRIWNDGAGRFTFLYADGTRFDVWNGGRDLSASQPSGSSLDDTLIYLLGPVLGFTLRLRERTSLHSSTVARNGRSICFVGGGGAGKSTLACALCQQGFRLLAEDISVLDTSGPVSVVPGHPRIHLWPDAAAALFGTGHSLKRLTPSWEKLYHDPEPATGRAPLDCVYVLDSRESGTDAPRIEQMPPRERLMALLANAYMNYLPDNEWRVRDLQVLGRLAEEVPVRRLVARAGLSTIRETCRLIERAVPVARERSG